MLCFFFFLVFVFLCLLYCGQGGGHFFLGDGGFVWTEAVAGPTLSHVRALGFFFSSLSVCVLWCGAQQEFNLF